MHNCILSSFRFAYCHICIYVFLQHAYLNTLIFSTCILAFFHGCEFLYMHTLVLVYLIICTLEYMHICITAYFLCLHTCILAYFYNFILAYVHSCILASFYTYYVLIMFKIAFFVVEICLSRTNKLNKLLLKQQSFCLDVQRQEFT